MDKNPYPGKFIVFEGLDGSGKSTQLHLLDKYLKKLNCKTALIDFPQYTKKSAGLIEEYLSGKYGSAEQVGPWRASIFYACDRYDASFEIRKWLEQGKIVISDRYLASNIGHQGGKIKNKKERSKYIKWLYNLEYNIFEVPKPDITIILRTSAELSYKMSVKNIDRAKKQKAYLKNKKRDIHEANLTHLELALNSYLQAAKEFPKDFKVIECLKNNQLLPPEEIHQKILAILNKLKLIN